MYKILIVDDEREIVEVIENTVRKEGYQTVVAYDGQEALERFKAENPDLVILDINLPKINGLAVCEEIKSSKDFTPVIFITGKFTEIKDKVEGLKAGVDDYLTKPFDLVELIVRVKAMLRLKTMHEKLKLLNKQLAELSVHDPLTTVYNRRYLMDRLEGEIKRASRTKGVVSFILIDIDDFKFLNDNYGHTFGDFALVEIANFLKHNIRQTDVLARYGGDEFLIVAPDAKREGTIILAKKLLEGMRKTTFKKDGFSVTISFSFGVSSFDGKSLNKQFIDNLTLKAISNKLINDADKELYEAKKGR